jgi:AcrR family transcriptional regulator
MAGWVKIRVRRTPEEARTLILDAAERVFATRLPDTVGLKEVAREADVAHSLITHYFGTYEAMVETTLERRFQIVREEMMRTIGRLVGEDADAKAILAAYRAGIVKAASNPATVRLVTWAILSGRAGAADFFPNRIQGLRLLVDAMSQRSTVPREDLEFLVISIFGIAAVSTYGSRAFAGSLGRKSISGEAFNHRVDEMVGGFLRTASRRSIR